MTQVLSSMMALQASTKVIHIRKLQFHRTLIDGSSDALRGIYFVLCCCRTQFSVARAPVVGALARYAKLRQLCY